jgi:integrase
MDQKSSSGSGQEALFAELEAIRDTYRQDVRQFVDFLRSGKLHIVEGFKRYAKWLDEEHQGKRYSAATVNRKLAAARNRVRYAFKHSAWAGSLRRKYQLEDILKSVKLKKVGPLAVPSDKVLDIEEARKLVWQAKDRTVRFMVTFLVLTGVRVSEMLGLKLEDVKPAKRDLVEVRVKGKGGRERIVYAKKDYVDQVRKHFHGKTYLFEHSGRPYNRISVTNRIKIEALRILGREVTPRQLRHTWAAIQIKRGRSVKAVAAVLGHADPGLTARMYTEASVKPEDSILDLDTGTRKDSEKR